MATVRLPEIPEGEYLEDHVAAHLQCGGFYTEKSLIERGETEIMEIDIMAWKPDDRPPQHTLFEVKGGKWGFSDIFKVYGWKTYLQPRALGAAYLIAPRGNRTEKVIEYIQNKCRDMELVLIAHDDLASLESNLKELGLTLPKKNQLDHAIWRFSFWLERQMQKVVTNSRRSLRENRGPGEIYKYQELIRNGFLQARDVRERLAILYRSHFDHPFLAMSVAAELDGSEWDAENPSPGTHWRNALHNCKHPLIQAAMYHEHRAKLDILKGAVEFALLKKYDALPPKRTIKILDGEIPGDFLPGSFHSSVQEMQSIEGFEKFAVLWQSFLWKWGGFFLMDKEKEEKSALAKEIGIDVASVDSAMDLYDDLFPIERGWFHEFQGTRVLKLFPCQFRGIGVFYRRLRMGAESLGEAYGSLPHQYLVNNLTRWNNSTVELLQYGASNENSPGA